MSLSNQYTDIMVGDEVFGSDGEKLGKVADVAPGYVTVEKGFFFPTDYYIPRSVVQGKEDGQIFLTVPRDAALNNGWDQPPTDLQYDRDLMADDTVLETQFAGRSPRRATGTTPMADDEEIHVPLASEELTATVRPVEAGAAHISKRVVEEDRVLDVPVTEERMRVERRAVDRPLDAADQAPFEEIDIDVPLRQEAVDVQKQTRVMEDVVISKEKVQHTERVADTVRREELDIAEDPRIDEVNPPL